MDDPTAHSAGKKTKEGRGFAEGTAEAIKDIAGERKDAAADFIRALAVAAEKGADELDHHGRSGSASVIRQTSQEIVGFAKHVSSRNPGDLAREFQDLARRRPTLVAGAALLLGFGAMRFFMSSADRPTQEKNTREEAARGAQRR
jgi:hypothetical protein